MLVPRFCTGTEGTNTLQTRWEGACQERDDGLLGSTFSQGMDDCTIMSIFKGTVDDEWSILFDWLDLNSTAIGFFYWAEVWYDHEDEQIHYLVRNCEFQNELVYGSNTAQPHFKARPVKTLGELAEMLDICPWDECITTNATADLDAERAKSRAYKRSYTEQRKTALAMALHGRLGEGSALASLGDDVLSQILV